MNALLLALFGLVGAHVPKAFSVLYVALILSSLMSLWRLSQLGPLRGDHNRLFRLVQILVLIFLLAYPVSMLRHGFWELTGRGLLDVLNAFVLPSWLLWWGHHWARVDFRRLQAWLLAYAVGALLFFVAALLKTRGIYWWLPGVDPGTLFLAWGNKVSMNIRSVEQNGILAVTLAPLSGWLFLRHRWCEGVILLVFSLVGWLAVTALGGTLWIPSLVLSCLPLIAARFCDPIASLSFWRATVRRPPFLFLLSSFLVSAIVFLAGNSSLPGQLLDWFAMKDFLCILMPSLIGASFFLAGECSDLNICTAVRS